MVHIIREAIKIKLHPNNMNREVDFVSASHSHRCKNLKSYKHKYS
jgi:hypothetical protein